MMTEMTNESEEAALFDLERQVLRAVQQVYAHRERSKKAAQQAVAGDAQDAEERSRFEQISRQHAELAQVTLMTVLSLAADLPIYPDFPLF